MGSGTQLSYVASGTSDAYSASLLLNHLVIYSISLAKTLLTTLMVPPYLPKPLMIALLLYPGRLHVIGNPENTPYSYFLYNTPYYGKSQYGLHTPVRRFAWLLKPLISRWPLCHVIPVQGTVLHHLGG